MSSLPLAVWVVGGDRRVSYVNAEAARLFGRDAAACVGRPCHELVGGRGPDGHTFCETACPVLRAVRRRGQMGAFDLLVGGDVPRCLRVYVGVMCDGAKGHPTLVHFAEDVSDRRQAEKFVSRIAHRSAGENDADASPRRLLSAREAEVIELLARDATLEEIAVTLGITYATVRNHVQHALVKLGAHSTLEAVARYILDEATPDRP